MENNEKLEAYSAARDTLRRLIDQPDKTVPVDEYRARIEAARIAVKKAHKAWMETQR